MAKGLADHQSLEKTFGRVLLEYAHLLVVAWIPHMVSCSQIAIGVRIKEGTSWHSS